MGIFDCGCKQMNIDNMIWYRYLHNYCTISVTTGLFISEHTGSCKYMCTKQTVSREYQNIFIYPKLLCKYRISYKICHISIWVDPLESSLTFPKQTASECFTEGHLPQTQHATSTATTRDGQHSPNTTVQTQILHSEFTEFKQCPPRMITNEHGPPRHVSEQSNRVWNVYCTFNWAVILSHALKTTWTPHR